MDVLSDVLSAVRISGSALFRAEFSGPWSLSAPHTREFASMLIPNARRMMMFHIIAEGACTAECEGCEHIELRAGDVLVLPYGDGVIMSDRPGLTAEPVMALLPPPPWRTLPVLRYGGDGAMTRILCGFLHADEVTLHPLLAEMPAMLRVRSSETFPRLQSIVRYALDEAQADRPGTTCLMTRLADVLFVEILRQHLEETDDDVSRPLMALRHPVVSRVLALLHGDPGRHWSLELLATEAAVSRSVLVERFNAILGCPPMHYLTRWRIQLAARRLSEGRESTAAIAADLGYESEPAFHRAFKRHLGEPPGAWRRRQQGQLAAE